MCGTFVRMCESTGMRRGSAVTPALFNAFARGITMKLVADKGQVAQGFGFAAIVIAATSRTPSATSRT